eukprot:386055-Rhodomonas_salina.3
MTWICFHQFRLHALHRPKDFHAVVDSASLLLQLPEALQSAPSAALVHSKPGPHNYSHPIHAPCRQQGVGTAKAPESFPSSHCRPAMLPAPQIRFDLSLPFQLRIAKTFVFVVDKALEARGRSGYQLSNALTDCRTLNGRGYLLMRTLATEDRTNTTVTSRFSGAWGENLNLVLKNSVLNCTVPILDY